MTHDPSDVDWCAAACADARAENLTMTAIQAAYEVSDTPEQFFWAVRAAIMLKETTESRNGSRGMITLNGLIQAVLIVGGGVFSALAIVWWMRFCVENDLGIFVCLAPPLTILTLVIAWAFSK